MTTDSTGRDEQLKNSFQKVLDQHGYGFQYAVLNAAKAATQIDSKWRFEVSEFPVQVQGSNTKIDFILQHVGSMQDSRKEPYYLLAECKRANPSLSNWCFVRAPYIHRKHRIDNLLLEYYERTGYNAPSMVKSLATNWNAYHIAVEVKSGNTGDSHSSGKGAIEEAATQACRGLNGMLEFWAQKSYATGNQMKATFLPVIFTTAHIWVSDVDLSTSEVDTGKINFTNTSFVKKSWIVYQYHMTPNLKHSYIDSRLPDTSIGEFMESEYIRSIIIVNPAGIGNFLATSSSLFDDI